MVDAARGTGHSVEVYHLFRRRTTCTLQKNVLKLQTRVPSRSAVAAAACGTGLSVEVWLLSRRTLISVWQTSEGKVQACLPSMGTIIEAASGTSLCSGVLSSLTADSLLFWSSCADMLSVMSACRTVRILAPIMR